MVRPRNNSRVLRDEANVPGELDSRYGLDRCDFARLARSAFNSSMGRSTVRKVLGLYLERPLEADGRSDGLVDGRFGYSDLKGAVAGSRAYGFCIWSE
jgi:hypothetical protein